MLISPSSLKFYFGVKPTGILHVGAHQAEEYELYKAAGWLDDSEVIWVEAQAELAAALERRKLPNASKVVCAAAWHENGAQLKFNLASNSQSSSLFELGTHALTYPEIKFQKTVSVFGQRLDSLIEDPAFNLIALDIQGAELNALMGLGKLLEGVSWIYTECNKEEVYKGVATIDVIDEYVNNFGFTRVATRWVPDAGWGDCLYIKLTSENLLRKIRIAFGTLLFACMNQIFIFEHATKKLILRINPFRRNSE